MLQGTEKVGKYLGVSGDVNTWEESSMSYLLEVEWIEMGREC